MNHLSSWFHGIKGRLLFSSVLPIIGFGVVGFISMTGTGRIVDLLHSANRSIIPNLKMIEEFRVARNRFGYLSFEAISNLQEEKDSTSDLEGLKSAVQDFEKAYQSYQATTFMPEEETQFRAAKTDFDKFHTSMKTIQAMIESKEPEKLKLAEEKLKSELAPIGEKIRDYTTFALKIYLERAQSENIAAVETESSVKWGSIITVILSNLVISSQLLWLASSLSKSVGGIAARLSGASGNVATSVEQLSEAGNSLSQSSTEAAASLEETVASLEELSSMVRQNSDNAMQAAALSATSREAAEKGQKEIEHLIHSMTKISQSSKKIEEIIHVIDDIAFQTNLLALNAAVEAARAGEQGKGFAVVAEAVRSLAQRSAVAAKDINNLIKDSVAQVDEGGRVAGQSGVVLNNIVSAVKKVSDLNNEISTASSEQTAGIQQISKAMNQLDQSSQSNAASAEEIAATSGEISGLAQASLALSSDLNTVIFGKGAHAPTAPAAKGTVNLAKVIALASRAPKKAVVSKHFAQAQSAIPFDEDDFGRQKVGTTNGF